MFYIVFSYGLPNIKQLKEVYFLYRCWSSFMQYRDDARLQTKCLVENFLEVYNPIPSTGKL